MNHRPLIGINTDFRVSPKDQGTYSLMPSGYYDCLLTANALPVMIPPLIRESELIPILENLDGVVLTGGDDLDPRKMGLSPHPSVSMMPERRELSIASSASSCSSGRSRRWASAWACRS